MPQRVSDTDVKAILQTVIDTTPFILAASLMVDQYLVSDGLSEPLLFEIERWLAAHLACARDPRVLDAREGTVTATFQRVKPGTGLHATSYGEQVILLDPTGLLEEAMRATRRASIHVD